MTEAAALADLRAWIDVQLAALGAQPTGPIEQIRDQPWSQVLLVPTDQGRLFVKASSDALRHETAIAALVSRRHPEIVPAPLAVDLDRGWMLMADAGARLRELVEAEHDVSRWLDVLPVYAQLQAGMAAAVPELLALGTPDMRLAILPERYAALLDELETAGEESDRPAGEMRRLRDAMPRVAALCTELAGYGIAETLQHDDLNDGAVYSRDDRYVILDWGDACISHPFFSMSVTLEGVIAWGPDDVEGSVDLAPYRDAYLAPYAGGRSSEEMRTALELAVRLGWACRAVNGHLPGNAAPTLTRLRMFLDGHP